ncbi:MAG: hypothetical protein M0Q95_10875 [Porticoccaceae bacterium]|nr:hypothetical protein [Porticoccaceae bacterium]
MSFSEFPPFILIPAYLVVVLIIGLFWFVAVPVYCFALLTFALADLMKRVIRAFQRFDAYLSEALDELWRGII